MPAPRTNGAAASSPLLNQIADTSSGLFIHALKAARDALNTSALFGLRVAFVGADRNVQALMTRLPAAAFFCAQMVDASAEHLSVYLLQERERRRRTALRALSSFDLRCAEQLCASCPQSFSWIENIRSVKLRICRQEKCKPLCRSPLWRATSPTCETSI